jgi:phosphate acetyltransferase
MALPDLAQGHNGLMAFADCAVVVTPDAMQMADIAIATAESTRVLIGAAPAVALLSFSTRGSGKGPQADKVVEALEILRRARRANADGELQAEVSLTVGQSGAGIEGRGAPIR